MPKLNGNYRRIPGLPSSRRSHARITIKDEITERIEKAIALCLKITGESRSTLREL